MWIGEKEDFTIDDGLVVRDMSQCKFIGNIIGDSIHGQVVYDIVMPNGPNGEGKYCVDWDYLDIDNP